jgi:hypothetical protein
MSGLPVAATITGVTRRSERPPTRLRRTADRSRPVAAAGEHGPRGPPRRRPSARIASACDIQHRSCRASPHFSFAGRPRQFTASDRAGTRLRRQGLHRDHGASPSSQLPRAAGRRHPAGTGRCIVLAPGSFSSRRPSIRERSISSIHNQSRAASKSACSVKSISRPAALTRMTVSVIDMRPDYAQAPRGTPGADPAAKQVQQPLREVGPNVAAGARGG